MISATCLIWTPNVAGLRVVLTEDTRQDLVDSIYALNEIARDSGGHLQVWGTSGYKVGCVEEAGIDVSLLEFV